jgi:hypothetical protein
VAPVSEVYMGVFLLVVAPLPLTPAPLPTAWGEGNYYLFPLAGRGWG